MLHQIWNSALDSKNPEDKSLEELTELVRDEAKLSMPKHQMRMNLIQTKRGSERHRDFLEKISELWSVAEYEDMTGDEFQTHLFIESANSHMRKLPQTY